MDCPAFGHPTPAPTFSRPYRAPPYSNAHRITLERLFARISEISALPQVAQRILKLASQDSSTIEDLRQSIQTDPALAARVLRRVNSSYFGLSGKVADLRAAVSLLGFREIRNICLTIFVSRMFNKPGSYGSYSREALWRHCTAAAFASRKIARATGAVVPDEAYVAGLLHHIGTILLDQHLHREFCKILGEVDESTPTYLVERRILSFDQAQLGEFIARRWHFPKQISDAIRYYHYPEQYDGPHRNLVTVVGVANFLCSRAGWTSLGVQNATAPTDEACSSLGLNRAALSLLWNELQMSLPEAATI